MSGRWDPCYVCMLSLISLPGVTQTVFEAGMPFTFKGFQCYRRSLPLSILAHRSFWRSPSVVRLLSFAKLSYPIAPTWLAPSPTTPQHQNTKLSLTIKSIH